MTKTKFIAVAAAVLLTTMATACGDKKPIQIHLHLL